MKKILVGLLGGLIAFVWSSVIHMTPATATLGLSLLGAKEDAVRAGLKSGNVEPGLYFFPGMDMRKSMSKEEEAAWTAKYKAGPSGLLLIEPVGVEPMSPRQLIVEFVSTLLCGLIAASITASTIGAYRCRVLRVMALGLFTWLAISVSQWNWYAFPFSFIALDGIDQVGGWLVAGLVMAKMLPAPKSAD